MVLTEPSTLVHTLRMINKRGVDMTYVLPPERVGSRFKPVGWGPNGWGISERPKGKRGYAPRCWNGELHPFKTKIQAKRICDELNK